MNKIEKLAFELAILSNDSLSLLSELLVREYPTRAAALEQLMSVAQQEYINQLHSELGVANVR